MHQLTALPHPLGRFIATFGHHIDRRLPGRHKGRIARLLGPQPGRYVSPELGTTAALLSAFAKSGIRYAIIGRGDQAVPFLNPHLTVMVEDEQAKAASRFISPWPAGEPVQAFSPSGLPGFAFGDMPVLPTRLARRLLDGAALTDGLRLADPVDRFMASVFSIVYLRPSLIDVGNDRAMLPSLAAAIASQAGELDIKLSTPITHESLDALLMAHDWEPPIDMQERIGCWNPWVAEKLRRTGDWVGGEPAGLVIFYIRQRAIHEGKTELILDELQRSGFRLLPTPSLTAVQLEAIGREVRGGNWGRGPFPQSGGPPGAVVVGFDPNPIPPNQTELEQFPLLDNSRIQQAKQSVRRAVHKDLPRAQHYNAMHSTDNAVQAWRAVREYYSAREDELRALIHDK